jgi:replicative DNA helicase
MALALHSHHARGKATDNGGVVNDKSITESQGRLPPHNLEMERAFLGVLLLHNDAIDKVQGIVEPDDFYEKVNATIYENMLMLANAQKPFDVVSIKSSISGIDFSGASPLQYLMRVTAEATTLINVAAYGRAIADDNRKRKLIEAAEKIKDLAYGSNPTQTVEMLIAESSGLLDDVSASGALSDGVVTFGQAATSAVKQIANSFDRDSNIAGISTGYPSLDAVIGGFSDTDVIVLGGRPAMGKSALASNIATYIAMQSPNKKAIFFSQEMSAEQLVSREISRISKVPLIHMKNGTLTQEEFERVLSVEATVQNVEMVIDARGSLKLSQIASKLRQESKKKPISLVVIDYLTLMQGSGKSKGRGDNRTQEVSEITAGLKSLAKLYRAPFLILAQLSRDVERRDDKRPILADLRESGSIEQDSDVVLFVYREAYYLKKPASQHGEAWERYQAELERWRGITEVIVGKNRHGPTDTCLLGFDAETTSFRELIGNEKDIGAGYQSDSGYSMTIAAKRIYPSIKQALERLGSLARTSACPTGKLAITTSEAFGEYLASLPFMEGDNAEKTETKARAEFKEGLDVLRRENVVVAHNATVDEKPMAWLWLGDRKVKK